MPLKENLRDRAKLDLIRLKACLSADFPGIAVPYHEDKLSRACGTQGRLTPGVSDQKAIKEQAYNQQITDLVAMGMSMWQATRAMQSGPKFYKEIARGQKVMDSDRPKSFPNTIHDRYPDLEWVAMWCEDPAQLATRAGFDITDPDQYKLCKEFINSAAGSGKTFEETWLLQAGMPILPDVLGKYRDQLRTAAERDYAARPELVAALEKPGMDLTAVQNKVHYVVNSEMERREADEAMGKRADMCRTVAYESDGFPCVVSNATHGAAIMAKMNAGLPLHKHYIHKPYKSAEEMKAFLMKRFPEIPAHEFDEVDPDWEDKATNRLHFKKYLKAGIAPLNLAQYLVPEYIYMGRRVSESICTVVGTKDMLDYRKFEMRKFGGHWITIHRKNGDKWLTNVCAAFCSEVEGRDKGTERPCVQDLSLPKKMREVVNPNLYNSRILCGMNMQATWHLLQFDCGRILDTKTMEVRPGRAEDYISFSTGYEYPMELKTVLGLCGAPGRLQANGIDLRELFVAIRDYELGLGDITPLVKYPATIEKQLVTLAAMPEFELLKMSFTFFENWPVVVFRCLKVLTCGLFSVPTKAFVHDRGDSGDNGKTVFQVVTETVGGQYYHEITSTMVTNDPPPSSSPTPDLYALIGKRLFGTPELGKRKAVNGEWMKRVADPGCNWTAREPHACTPIPFKLNAMFCVSTNAKLEFDFKDGGCENRGIGVYWPFKFGAKPKPGTFEREAAEKDIKNKEIIIPMVPGFYLILETVFDVFYKGGHHEKPARKVPLAVQQATEELVSEETVNTIHDIIDGDFKPVEDKGLTFAGIKKYLDAHPLIEALIGSRPSEKTTKSFIMVLEKCLRSTANNGKRTTLYNGTQIVLKPIAERKSMEGFGN